MAGREHSASCLVRCDIAGKLSMPRYLFHVHDGTELTDDEGLYLPGDREDRAEAVRAAGEMGIVFDFTKKSPGTAVTSRYVDLLAHDDLAHGSAISRRPLMPFSEATFSSSSAV